MTVEIFSAQSDKKMFGFTISRSKNPRICDNPFNCFVVVITIIVDRTTTGNLTNFS